MGKCVGVWGEVRKDVGESVSGLPTLCPSPHSYTPTHFVTPISTLPTSSFTPQHNSVTKVPRDESVNVDVCNKV